MDSPLLTDNCSSHDALGSESGIHTYIGCSICEDGTLRLISYLNPQSDKMKAASSGRATSVFWDEKRAAVYH